MPPDQADSSCRRPTAGRQRNVRAARPARILAQRSNRWPELPCNSRAARATLPPSPGGPAMNQHAKPATTVPVRHLARGMAGADRPGRRLSAVRALRLGRRDLQSLLDAGAGRADQVPDEAARAAVDRGHRLEPPQGRHERRPRREVGRQPAGLHAARRRAVRPPRRQLRGPRPHRDRHGDRRPQARAADGVAAGDPVLQPRRLSRLRGHHRGLRGARPHQPRPRPEPRADHAQPRPAHRRHRPRARPSC